LDYENWEKCEDGWLDMFSSLKLIDGILFSVLPAKNDIEQECVFINRLLDSVSILTGIDKGDIMTIHCSVGHHFDDRSTTRSSMCSDKGQWNPTIPSCTGILCNTKNWKIGFPT